MEVTSIQSSIIIDHVPAGTSLKVLDIPENRPSQNQACAHHERRLQALRLQRTSSKSEDDRDIDLDVLGFLARQATVDVVRGGKISSKQPNLPEHIVGVISCVNPRCVTTAEARHQARCSTSALPERLQIPLRLLRRGR